MNSTETHQTVPEPQPGDGVEISAARARQGYNRGSSHRIFWVLAVSLVVAVVALFAYWASVSRDLQTADRSGGQIAAEGQRVTDPATVAQFNAPEPAPKQPSTDAIERSQTGETTVPTTNPPG
jgi:hypothetical protein